MVRSVSARGLVVIGAAALLGVIPLAASQARADGPVGNWGRRHFPGRHAHAHAHGSGSGSSSGSGFSSGPRSGGVKLAKVGVSTSSPNVPVVPGRTYSWPYSIINRSPVLADQVLFSVPLPSALHYVSAQQNCAWQGNAVLCRVGSLRPGQSAVGVINALVDSNLKPGQSVSSPAQVSWCGTRPGSGSVGAGGSAGSGGKAGSAGAGAGLAGSAESGGVAGHVACGSTAAGALVGGGRCTAQASSGTSDSRPSSGTAATRPGKRPRGKGRCGSFSITGASATTAFPPVKVAEAADVAVTKSGPMNVRPGQSMAYAMTVTNNGPSVAKNVVLRDTVQTPTHTGEVVLPSGQESAGCAGAAQPMTTVCGLGTLGVGQSRTVKIEVRPGSRFQPGMCIPATSQVSSSTADTNMSNNVASTCTKVTPLVASRAVSRRLVQLPNTGAPVTQMLDEAGALIGLGLILHRLGRPRRRWVTPSR